MKKFTRLLLGTALAILVGHAVAQTVSPVQSPARPFGLDIAGPVMLSGSDTESSYFNTNFLTHLQDLQDDNLAGVATFQVGDFTATRLDSSQLSIANGVDMRVYFVGEGADFHNTLGFNTAGPGVSSGNPQLIFPDASIASQDRPWWWPWWLPYSSPRTTDAPLRPGDFVDTGFLSAGTNLDFFLVADGANGGTDVYSTTDSVNPDGLSHAAAWLILDSPYLLFSFEDTFGGGDLDYNDVIFVANIGMDNVAVLAPEPGLLAILAGFLGMAGLVRYRLRRRRN